MSDIRERVIGVWADGYSFREVEYVGERLAETETVGDEDMLARLVLPDAPGALNQEGSGR
ncbi:hypothetical protein JQR85_03765 [Stutzerimonas urumqiensis]|uniref:hypothetical protein n=1 Tax=Stutzerimonas urumqiensis TaxID=638269 RepID=UPI000EAD1EAF|nr:hypothetical protein [Stutzerimonas urumqiensis]